MASKLGMVAILLAFGISFILGEDELNLTDGEKQSLAQLDLDSLPDSIQRSLRSVVIDPTAHWCCRINPTKVVVNSKAVQLYVRRATQHTNYGHCGVWGWRRCAHNSVTYYQSSTYKTVYSKKTVETTCPKTDVVCCNGFLQVAHNCLLISELAKQKDELAKLKEKGVLVG